uniref:Uncharacterized protein n=1 Tax=viral metagenome TaxID=1070528 RepID=A0A6C0CXP2_9ZZZZ
MEVIEWIPFFGDVISIGSRLLSPVYRPPEFIGVACEAPKRGKEIEMKVFEDKAAAEKAAAEKAAAEKCCRRLALEKGLGILEGQLLDECMKLWMSNKKTHRYGIVKTRLVLQRQMNDLEEFRSQHRRL